MYWKKFLTNKYIDSRRHFLDEYIFLSLKTKLKAKKKKKWYKIVEMRKYIKRWNCSQLNTLTGGIHLNNNESEAFKSFMFAVLSFSPFAAFTVTQAYVAFCARDSLSFSVSCYSVHSLFFFLLPFLNV